ncbi:DL-endopeptidase inhibitor IseA family protein [Niallia endozanthoxylica]|uniref:DL-endopeptidase inhibitor IseA family protein n=1 Tax=Niallia endozanthoxylica TaxID=2036016 RepID=UPI00168A90E0|nr:DL-endopeptidase inhibitor IseA family protein [Niallia endozanthoxylica]
MKKIVMTGIAALIFGSAFLQTEEGFAHSSDAPHVEMVQMQDYITDELVVKNVSEWMMLDSYISGGGDYKEGEYKTFIYKKQTYRYLSKEIDTKKELIGYLKTSLTTDYAEQYIRNKGIIVHKGKLAQLEADGGSLLQWNHAVAVYDSTTGNERIYTLTVPIGDTGQHDEYLVSFRFDERKGWKISKAPTLVN